MGCGVSNIRDHKEKPTYAKNEDGTLVPKTNIDDLPDECLLQILHCLGPVHFWKEHIDKDKVVVRNPSQCALVCKRWRALADRGVDCLRLLTKVDIPHLLRAFARWRCLRYLDLGHCGQKQCRKVMAFHSHIDLKTVLQSAASMLPFLESLRIEYSYFDLPDICTQACSLPHLKALELVCREIPPLTERSSEILHTLKLHSFRDYELLESLGLFTGLRGLSIDSSWVQSLPTSINQLSLLTRLDLQCHLLQDLAGSIGHLAGLRYLRVRDCHYLRACPQNLWDLRELRTLIWAPFAWTEIQPVDLHLLASLKDLRVAKIHHFEGLPEDLGDLQHLAKLELFYGRTSLSELPSSIANIRSLQILKLRSCPSLLRLPADIGAMASLREVDLQDCGEHMVSLPETMGCLKKLKKLRLDGLPSLVTLPEGLCECSSLLDIVISRCSSLQKLPEGLGQLSLLRRLYLADCNSLQTLPGTLGGLATLEELCIINCITLISLPKGLGALGKLQQLSIRGCPLREISSEIGNIITLNSLEINNCPGLLSLPPCPAAGYVDIRSCKSLVSLPLSMGSQHLIIRECSSLQEFLDSSSQQAPPLEGIKQNSLSVVSLSPSLSSFKMLKSLSIDSCPSLTGLPESLGQLKALENLWLSNCSSLTSLPQSVGSLSKLSMLFIDHCPLSELPESMGQLTSLQSLTLGECPMVSLPQSFLALKNLRVFILVSCSRFGVW